jgi:hypothetical protein
MNPRRVGRRVAGLAAALVLALAVQGCADPATVPAAAPAPHPCGAGTDAATARVVDVYVAILGHLARQPRYGGSGARVLYLVDHAVPELQEQGIPEWEKKTPAPASRSTAEFPAPVRRCLEGARFEGLPPIRLVQGWDDPAIDAEPVHPKGRPAGTGPDQPRRYVDGRLYSLGGVPDRGDRLALAASAFSASFDYSGGLFVLQRRGRTWRVAEQARYWVT